MEKYYYSKDSNRLPCMQCAINFGIVIGGYRCETDCENFVNRGTAEFKKYPYFRDWVQCKQIDKATGKRTPLPIQ